MPMTIPAEQMAERAAAWAESDAAVRAMIVYGSLAQGTADEDSDLDVIIAAEPGQRDALWDRREQISDLIHGHHAVRHQEPLWQRPYRYQSWDEKLIELDLTLDDRVHHAAPTSAEPTELRRSLRATAELYAWALDRWSQRTGQPVPRSPLTPAIMDKLRVLR
jgi:predicted nucleotidyltransferase